MTLSKAGNCATFRERDFSGLMRRRGLPVVNLEIFRLNPDRVFPGFFAQHVSDL